MQPRKIQVNYSDVAELEGLEFLNARYIEQTFSKHSHEGYTVGVIEHGAQGFYRTGGNIPRHRTPLFWLMPMKFTVAIRPLRAAGLIAQCIRCRSILFS